LAFLVGLFYAFFALFQQLKSAAKSRRRMKKQGNVECLSGSRLSLRTPQLLAGLRRKAKIGRACIGQFSALLPLSFQYVFKGYPCFFMAGLCQVVLWGPTQVQLLSVEC
jgi:hypothetical protein